VGYPVLRLRDHCAGPKSYVSLLEDVLIRTLADWQIDGRRRDRLPGVWVGSDYPMKIASIGVRISRGITTHGFALNVDMDLRPYLRIVPCGISGCHVTSMSAVLSTRVAITRVMIALAAHFADVFRLVWTEEHDLRAIPFGHSDYRLDHRLSDGEIAGDGMETGRW
jgi:lipoyl(octanoyl) transferase